MRTLIFAAAAALLFSLTSGSAAHAGEPLMQRGAASVTPADDTPPAAVDSLSEDASPAASANTTATDQIEDAVTSEATPETGLELENDPAYYPKDKAQ
jgi:outer membrane protein W